MTTVDNSDKSNLRQFNAKVHRTPTFCKRFLDKSFKLLTH